MDDKGSFVQHDEITTQDQDGSRRIPRSRIYVLLGLAVVYVLYVFSDVIGLPAGFGSVTETTRGIENVLSRRVSLEAHIMSKCPDARDCLRDLIVPVMANMSDKIDFTLSYIGRLGSQEDDNTVECKHGPSECLGNIVELCAANLYPDPKIYLGFTMCLTGDYSHIPQKELIQECALEHGVDFDALNECASKDDGSFGMDLLRNSVARSANANVTRSCTVRLNEKIRCIRDGGEWKDCPGGHSVEDLIRDIKRAAHDSQVAIDDI